MTVLGILGYVMLGLLATPVVVGVLGGVAWVLVYCQESRLYKQGKLEPELYLIIKNTDSNKEE